MAALVKGSGWIAELEGEGLRWRSMESDHPKSIYIRFNESTGSSRRSSGGSNSSSSSSSGSTILDEPDSSQWYVIPVSDLFYSYNPATDLELTLSPARFPRLIGLDDCTSVFLYPRIYVIGGTPTPYDTSVGSPTPWFTPTGRRDVYSYDITASPFHHGPWQKIKPMEAARSNPCVFVLDEKIFVFGGLNCCCCEMLTEYYDPGHCFATKPLLEIYDPKTETWEGRLRGGSLSVMHPGVKRLSPLFLDKRGHRHVLLHTAHPWLHTYDVDSDRVTPHREGLTFDVSRTATNAVVDGILFCYYDISITGYDMKYPHLPPLVVSGLTLGKELPFHDALAYANLLSIGESRLAILWSLPRFGDNDSLLHCSVVKVQRTCQNGKHGLHAAVEAFNTYSYCGLRVALGIDCLAF